jgi:hypothetical protein
MANENLKPLVEALGDLIDAIGHVQSSDTRQRLKEIRERLYAKAFAMETPPDTLVHEIWHAVRGLTEAIDSGYYSGRRGPSRPI